VSLKNKKIISEEINDFLLDPTNVRYINEKYSDKGLIIGKNSKKISTERKI